MSGNFGVVVLSKIVVPVVYQKLEFGEGLGFRESTVFLLIK